MAASDDLPPIALHCLGRRPYLPVWQAMRDLTDTRDATTPDQFWLVEHEPVFTQGQAGKPEHLLMPGDIPVVQTDRGGQVTYHGPGQVVLYPLLDVRRARLGVRDLVSGLENAVIAMLAGHGVEAHARPDAPGVYVGQGKIASLGLRIRRGGSFHGVAVNIDGDLSPFSRINPCGYAGMAMIRLADLVDDCPGVEVAGERLANCLACELGRELITIPQTTSKSISSVAPATD
ncbi:lipoyl(octanoyl) transferase LipB [Halomonas urumqiensis]|uniref:Octanoyltransferase n=1 Tax=Halomonas urumqiensis TaxID=1684789 RepID=A0A2N7UFK4_9GAMM|nr:lipoyl(octanoyl) transferase LipB [Halomonas urumqiensis]PMR79217.1 octanoyltransferase [Halomonas urumqiensis]PTB03892.1 lipoyl(octanoyl) transferase LipB [Halomonas urumqiensis]GHE19867.1 octanoyltransferase [Halomonas urumqiensis]